MNQGGLRAVVLVAISSPVVALTLAPEWMAQQSMGLRVLSLGAFAFFGWMGLEMLLAIERERERAKGRPPQLAAPGLRTRLRRARR